MVTREEYEEMQETESILRSRVNDIMEVHPDMHPDFQLQHSGDDFKVKPEHANFIYGKGRKDTVFVLIVPTQFNIMDAPPDAVDIINETENKIEVIGISRANALNLIETKGWILDSIQYGEWVRYISDDFLESLPGNYRKFDDVPSRSILRYGSGYVEYISFYQDEVHVTISMSGYEGEESVEFKLDWVLDKDIFEEKVKELTEKLAVRDKNANDEHRIEEYLKSHSAVCCIKKEFETKYLDPVMKESHIKKCIMKEINYLKNNFHRNDPWGKKYNVKMTVADRIKQLELVIK